MPLFNKSAPMIIPFLFLWIFLMIKEKNKRWFIAIIFPLTILCVDQTGYHIKKLELRERPWVHYGIESVRHLGGTGGKNKSFPSNHAANSVAMAVIFSYLFKRLRIVFWVFAGIIMFSRVYIGVHYPSDVFAGALLGGILAYGIIFLSEKLLSRINKKTIID